MDDLKTVIFPISPHTANLIHTSGSSDSLAPPKEVNSLRAVLQRVKKCRVTISGENSGEIGAGVLIFLGVGPEDTDEDVRYLAEKLSICGYFRTRQAK